MLTLNKRRFACIAITAAFCSKAAFAGFYIGGQLGQTNTNLNKLSSSLVAADTVKVASVVNTTISTVAINSFESSTKDKIVTEQIYLGYQFYPYLAFELGYFAFRDSTSSYSALITSQAIVNYSANNTSLPVLVIGKIDRKDIIKQNAIDFVAKGIVPLNNGFDLYAKIGGVYLQTRTTSKISMKTTATTSINTTFPINAITSSSTTTTKVYPTLSIGADYRISPNVYADFFWSRIVVNTNHLNNINTAGIGLAYHF